MSHEICKGCGKVLLAENSWMEDGCPCNSPKGVNDGNQLISHWRMMWHLRNIEQQTAMILVVLESLLESNRDEAKVAELRKQLHTHTASLKAAIAANQPHS